jgi:hypothetical protein
MQLVSLVGWQFCISSLLLYSTKACGMGNLVCAQNQGSMLIISRGIGATVRATQPWRCSSSCKWFLMHARVLTPCSSLGCCCDALCCRSPRSTAVLTQRYHWPRQHTSAQQRSQRLARLLWAWLPRVRWPLSRPSAASTGRM